MRVSQISVYPIKSLRGNSVADCKVTNRGLENDRRIMLIDAENSLISQRDFPRLATLKTSVKENGIQIIGSDSESLFVSNESYRSKLLKVRVWDSYCNAVAAPDEVNQWLSRFLNADCRLVRMPESTRRFINPKFNNGNEIVSFADGYPLLIIGEKSLEDLNRRLKTPIPMNRFRPNIVISDSTPFAEDEWSKIEIGKTVFRATKPCARCVVTTVDQEAGVSNNREPLRTLSKFRKAIDVFPTKFLEFDLEKNDVLFGVNLVPENFGEKVAVGDRVILS